MNEHDDSPDSSPTKNTRKTKKKFYSTFAPKKATDLSEAERFLKEPVGSRDQLEKYPTIKKIYK